jgi:hypothetical protein
MRIKEFMSDEGGAVTVDFVVLTAGIVGIAVAFMAPITSALGSVAVQIGETIAFATTFMQ